MSDTTPPFNYKSPRPLEFADVDPVEHDFVAEYVGSEAEFSGERYPILAYGKTIEEIVEQIATAADMDSINVNEWMIVHV